MQEESWHNLQASCTRIKSNMYCTALINVRKSAYDQIRNNFNLNHHDASLLAVSGPPPGNNNASLESRAVCKQERKKENKNKNKKNIREKNFHKTL